MHISPRCAPWPRVVNAPDEDLHAAKDTFKGKKLRYRGGIRLPYDIPPRSGCYAVVNEDTVGYVQSYEGSFIMRRRLWQPNIQRTRSDSLPSGR